jgi:hypothetical protein
VRSKGDQQPEDRVTHNQKLLNILGVDIEILATRVHSARKTRKMACQCGFVIRPKFDLQLAVAYIMNYPESVMIIGKHNPIMLYEMSECRGVEVGCLATLAGANLTSVG